jgi:uncharacterized membrane protein YqjE
MTAPDPPPAGGTTEGSSGTNTSVPAEARLLDLVGRISSDLSHLVHAELELAKVEIKDEVRNAAQAAGFLSGTAVGGYFVLLMLSFAAAFGLAEIMPTGFAFLIVGLLYGAVAATLFVMGRKKLATVTVVPKVTVRTLKEDWSWLKQQLS